MCSGCSVQLNGTRQAAGTAFALVHLLVPSLVGSRLNPHCQNQPTSFSGRNRLVLRLHPLVYINQRPSFPCAYKSFSNLVNRTLTCHSRSTAAAVTTTTQTPCCSNASTSVYNRPRLKPSPAANPHSTVGLRASIGVGSAMAALGMSGDAIGVGAARGASAAAVMDAARPVDLARHPSGIVPALQ